MGAKERPMPICWGTTPERHLGRDPEGRDYWLLRGSVFRTQFTGEERQKTTWVCTSAAWDAARKVFGV